MKVQCSVEWELGEQLDSGGFGSVFAAKNSEGGQAAVKLVPKEPGADRELLFEELAGARNVVPVIDRGETADSWVLVMPIAQPSLQSTLIPGTAIPTDQAVETLIDIATALVDISPIVVHRDLKPSNVLRFEGSWCLADFGISRYAEASTAADTRKSALTPAYAAPEQWRSQRATPATDVYALGAIAYQLLSGHLPFPGPTREDFMDQHLHSHPDSLPGAPARLVALVDHCLTKSPDARPTASQVLARLQQATSAQSLQGALALAAVNQAEVRRAAEASLAASQAQTEAEHRSDLAASAIRQLGLIGSELLETIAGAAPNATIEKRSDAAWRVALGNARLELVASTIVRPDVWERQPGPAFDIVVDSSISIHIPPDGQGYQGRSHSLYFCDAMTAGVFGWFETAFMLHPFSNAFSSVAPYKLSPADGPVSALAPGIGHFQVAWPFTELVPGEADEFLERWLAWFARAAQGQLTMPSTMPERPPEGSWRQS